EGALVEVEPALIIVLRRRTRRRDIAVERTARIVYWWRIRDVQGFLNGRKRDFCGVFDLFGIVRHVQSEPSFYQIHISVVRLSLAPTALQARNRPPARGAKARPLGRLVRYIRKHPIG